MAKNGNADSVTEAKPIPQGITEEVRIGAVLYGGVSLCIYINGVTQELLRLVEATAWDPKGLTGTRALYSKLAMLSSQDDGVNAEVRWGKMPQGESHRRRFVVDALSGTSAGGVNAVFLAKALANGQSLDGTKAFWIEEGGIEKLINDSESFKGLSLKPNGPPASLLNSQRMYDRLLTALDQMDDSLAVKKHPLVEEIDLFITTTDLAGRKVSVPLADQVVAEKDYHQAFRFSLQAKLPGDKVGCDFQKDNNPYLAFAARCTSAFPVAFEPMRGKDAENQLAAQGNRGLVNPKWDRFLQRNVLHGKDEREPDDGNPDAAAKAGGDAETGFQNRSFGDGGILDNKPFSYILDTLSARSAEPLVERKLIYIDPSPENPDDGSGAAKPDALDYAMKALIGLPGYETIRADVRNIINRNRVIDKVDGVTRGIVSDLKALKELPKKAAATPQPESAKDWQDRDLKDMLGSHGMAYGGYHRLKIASLTDEWASLIGKSLDWRGHPWRMQVLRQILRSWRSTNYHLNRTSPKTLTENRFLYDFDFFYRKRRLSFVLEKADGLLRSDPKVLEALDRKVRESLEKDGVLEEAFRHSLRDIKKVLKENLAELIREESALLTEGIKREMAASLRVFQEEFLQAYLQKGGTGTGTPADVKSAEVGQSLHDLKMEPERARKDKLQAIFAPKGPGWYLVEKLASVMDELRETKLPALFKKISRQCKSVLKPEAEMPMAVAYASEVLGFFYDDFDFYDMVLFPLTYCTDVGEGARMAIHRISPQSLSADATLKKSRPELAGAAFGHFGAFLDKSWRRNDLLWGRLDAVEKFIDMLLPATWIPEMRDIILAEGRNAILEEELSASIDGALKESIVNAFMVTTPKLVENKTDEGEVAKLEGKTHTLLTLEKVKELAGTASKDIRGDLRQSLLQNLAARVGWHQAVLVHRPGNLNRTETLHMLSRGSVVLGKLLNDIAQKREMTNPVTGGMVYVGRLLWGLVELTFPSGIVGGFLRKGVSLTLLIGLILILIGTFTKTDELSHLGWKLLAVVLAVDLIRFSLWSYAKNRGWGTLKAVGFFVAAVALLVLPGYFLVSFIGPDKIHVPSLHQIREFINFLWCKR